MLEQLKNLESIIQKHIEEKRYDKALSEISDYAEYAYSINQFYTNKVMEDALLTIEHNIGRPVTNINTVKGTVLFYDGFWNVDTRGLALVYLDALFELGFKVYYVTNMFAKNFKPVTEKLIREKKGKIVYLTEVANDYVELYKSICNAFEYIEPEHAFFYGYPHDVAGIMAFNRYANSGIIRYQINLTDHAFWLGVNVFDFCLEFREYGAGISHYKRGIAAEKLLMQPFYPWVGKKEKFAGYPFEREQDDFIIFSGGNVYKIIDKNKTYYKMVAEILKRHGNVKFWYASNCELPQDMKLLIEQFPGRVFFTDERIDLLAVLENIDMYLSTYPIAGGLMYQYVAMAGKVPYTLCADEESKGMLLNEEDLGIYYYDLEEMLSDVDKYITNEAYRVYKNNKMKNSVIKPEEFVSNLNLIMTEQKSAYSYTLKDYDVRNFQKIYYERAMINRSR